MENDWVQLFDAKLDSLERDQSEKHFDNICEQIKSKLISDAMTKRGFKPFAYFVLRKGLNSSSALQPLIAQVLLRLRNIAVEKAGLFGDFVSSIVETLPRHHKEFSLTFIQNLKFVNEMMKLGFVDVNIFLRFAQFFISNGESSDFYLPFVYEILRNYDNLVLNGTLRRAPDECSQYVCYLAAIFRFTGPVWDERLLEISNYVRIKAIERKHTHTHDCGNVPTLPPPKALQQKIIPMDSTVLPEITEPVVNENFQLPELEHQETSWQIDELPVILTPIGNNLEIPGSSHQQQSPSVVDVIKRFKELLTTVDNFPERVNDIASEMTTLLYGSASQTAFTSPINALLDEILEKFNESKKIPQQFGQLLEILSKASVMVECDMAFTFLNAANEWAEDKFRCPLTTVDSVMEVTEKLWFRTELCKLVQFPFKFYKTQISWTLVAKMEPSAVYYMFRILQEFDKLVDCYSTRDGAGTYGEDEAAFFEATTYFLTLTCNRNESANFDKTPSILQALETISQKRGWLRHVAFETGEQVPSTLAPTSVPKIVKEPEPEPAFEPQSQPVLSETVPQPEPEPRPEPEREQENDNSEPGSFKLSGDIDFAIGNLKKFLRLQPPTVFTERVGTVLEKMFSQLDDSLMEPAAKLCTALAKVTSNCGKSFITELQEYCLLSYVNRKSEKTVEVKPEFPIRVRLQKLSECPKLVGKLIATSECLPVCFVVSFLGVLIDTKSEETYATIFDMLSGTGEKIEQEAAEDDFFGDLFEKCFEDLTQIRDSQTSSSKLKELSEEILALRESGWVSLTREQRAANKLKSMLVELENCWQQEIPADIFNRIRANNLAGCPSCDIFVEKLEEIAAQSRQPCIKEERVEFPVVPEGEPLTSSDTTRKRRSSNFSENGNGANYPKQRRIDKRCQLM